jgi:hypothetical protein
MDTEVPKAVIPATSQSPIPEVIPVFAPNDPNHLDLKCVVNDSLPLQCTTTFLEEQTKLEGSII